MTLRIINADVLDGLAQLPDESVHCVVTSPPYYGLRDYGVDGQIGLEATPEAFIARLVEVFREVRRVLRKDGTCWVNMGDSYASSGGAGWQGKNGQRADRRFTAPNMKPEAYVCGVKPKDLLGIPWMLAFALRADGWWLRSDIIWHKPNPMPESVTDRPTKSHEYLFLLTKAERYFYDAEAISESAIAPGVRVATPYTAFAVGSTSTTPYNGNARETRNKRSVWTIATAPFAEAHFATFPPELPEICIKAGCPKGGTVLDPFAGAGTTLMVADRLQRHGIGIELNPTYAAMAQARLTRDRGDLLELMESA